MHFFITAIKICILSWSRGGENQRKIVKSLNYKITIANFR